MRSSPPARRVVSVLFATGALALGGCDAFSKPSYCEKVYADGGQTPAFARQDRLFHDRASCQSWYDRVRKDDRY